MDQLLNLFTVIYKSLPGFTETSYWEILRAQLDREPAAPALCESLSIQNGNSSAAIWDLLLLDSGRQNSKVTSSFEPEIERLRKRGGK